MPETLTRLTATEPAQPMPAGQYECWTTSQGLSIVRIGPAGASGEREVCQLWPPVDLTHLHALELGLSHERMRLGDGSGPGAELRRVWIAQREREIACERAFLGLPPAVPAPAMSDDDLLAALGQDSSSA